MDKRKHYGRKIKKTRNLYRKKASAGKKVLGTVLFALALSVLVFLGFCIGKPLLDYLGKSRQQEPKAVWTPEASYSEKQKAQEQPEESAAGESLPAQDEPEISVQESSAVSAAPETSAPAQSSAETAPEPVSGDAVIAYEAPASVLDNRTSLSAALAKAKAAGYNYMVIQLKDKNGYFHYKSEIKNVQEKELVLGSMSLPEIMAVFSESELTPIAEISVLSDNAGCAEFTDMSFKCVGSTMSWLDYTSNPPARWSNPESTATMEYFSLIIGELGSYGIKDIVLTDVIYPNFQPYDAEFIDGRYFRQDRYKLLYNVIKAGNIIEVRAQDVLAESFGRTAEILYDTSLMHDNSIALVINRKAFTVENGYPADAVSLVELIVAQCAAKAGTAQIIPVIESSSFGDADAVRVTQALRKMGYSDYIVR